MCVCVCIYIYIYIMEYYSAINKEWNNVICCNMYGPRDSLHTKWSKPDREKQISYDTAYMWNLKKNDTNEFIYKTETDPQT